VNQTIARLREAVNAHDPAAMAALMAPDYRSEQPVHPNRAFVGNQQVVANWTEMFRGVPDMTVEVLAEATEGTTSFSEWSWTGHHADGSDFAVRGVIVAGLDDTGIIRWMRLYVEPVEVDSAGIADAVRGLSGTEG
jgi:ketosteroid isomerase-like protein